ncbi:General stress protein 69 [Jeotgalicoccus coquinae]|jgi:hypothetical protein|uniref:General stress protein 69 n=2 Tax=Jeotgalicoccus coquinae TaxID=709509 RepID=A0A6V7R240_9STAP|nr:General stress protein 69 [Jeotgalicoccus coquinae]
MIEIGGITMEQLYEDVASYTLNLSDDDVLQITDFTALEPIYPHWYRAMNTMDMASE